MERTQATVDDLLGRLDRRTATSAFDWMERLTRITGWSEPARRPGLERTETEARFFGTHWSMNYRERA
ncbi:hypothetical protein ACFV20_15010 [Streptomyces sp. NPDC059696]|uniref:hypothetical protein n=1 Tax=Streptomyces sp. NPDC059696 TaxID=3346911 RepID=UPI0036A1E30F